jgi:hypothetical protein
MVLGWPGPAVGSVARGSYLKEGSQVHLWNRPICGGGRLLFLLGGPCFWAFPGISGFR